MKPFLFVVALPLLLLSRSNIAYAEQWALRARPNDQVLSRSLNSNLTIFEPTSEEVFYTVGDDTRWVYKSTHEHPRGKFVNFEKFEDYLRPQDRLCTPSADNKTAVLSFPLDSVHYAAARTAWTGKKNLIFMGHDPSCFAPHEERSSFRSSSTAFDDTSHTVQVTAKALKFEDRHFPAPISITIGSAPSDVTLTRRRRPEKRVKARGLKCLKHPIKCLEEKYEKAMEKVTDINFPAKHITLTSDINGEKKHRYWPIDHKPNSALPGVEVDCIDCETSGAMDQVYHVQWYPRDHGDDDDDDDDEENKHDSNENNLRSRENDDHKKEAAQIFKDHVKRAYIQYTVTEEIKLRKQLHIKTNGGLDFYCTFPIPIPGLVVPGAVGGCGTFGTAAGLSWEPGAVKAGDPGSSKSVSHFGVDLWPMAIGVFLWADFGVSTGVDIALPGFEATVDIGDVMEVDIMGNKTGIGKKFTPKIEVLDPDLSLTDTEVHVNIAIGPKAGLNIRLPFPFNKVGLGLGAKYDIVRIDNKLGKHNNVTRDCKVPKENENAFEKALGYTMDIKTGFYAYVNLLGFYVDTSWLGDFDNNGMPGLYWGLKNILAYCVDCGNQSCVTDPAAKLFGIADGTVGKLLAPAFKDIDLRRSVRKVAKVTDLEDSVHVNKDSINSLDDKSIIGMNMPTGDPETSCSLESAGSPSIIYRSKRSLWEPRLPVIGRGLLGRDDDHKNKDVCKQKSN